MGVGSLAVIQLAIAAMSVAKSSKDHKASKAAREDAAEKQATQDRKQEQDRKREEGKEPVRSSRRGLLGGRPTLG